MPDTLHVYVPLHYFCSLHIDSTLLNTFVKNQIACNIHLPYYYKICYSNKYGPQGQMPKAHDVPLWGKCRTMKMMKTPQPNYI